MDNKKKKQSSCLVRAVWMLAVPAALAIAAYASYQFVRNSYANEQKLIAGEISGLKLPSDEEIRQEAAKSANLEYPVEKPLKTPEQIAKEAEASARKMTNEKFQTKFLSGQISEIIKSFNEATPGKRVEFISKNASETVSGIYKGRDGLFVLVDQKKYSIRDILDEYKYLFDSDLATARAQEKIKELKASFKDARSKYFEENRKRIEEELRASSGYMRTEGENWRAKSDILDEAFEKLKLQKESGRQEEIKRILMKHKLFGIFKVSAA